MRIINENCRPQSIKVKNVSEAVAANVLLIIFSAVFFILLFAVFSASVEDKIKNPSLGKIKSDFSQTSLKRAYRVTNAASSFCLCQ